jgi:hypothetical protein
LIPFDATIATAFVAIVRRTTRPADDKETVMNVARSFLVGGLASVLAACAGSGVVYDFQASTQYSRGHVVAASESETLVVVRNSPFTTDTNHAGVVAAMQGRHLGPELRLTTERRGSDPERYKLVVHFGTGTGNPCAETTSGGAPAALDRLNIAFCARDFTLTRVSGNPAGASGPSDPRFRTLVGQMMMELMPTEDPFGRTEDCVLKRC